ncbi:MAG: transporter [Acidobacteria bacterium]|nr:transporter [Acidobacteriota bacterium]
MIKSTHHTLLSYSHFLSQSPWLGWGASLHHFLPAIFLLSFLAFPRWQAIAMPPPGPPPELLSQATVSPSDDQRPIQDNSFLIEEAYNQETGVVQHISFFNYFPDSEEWIYTFTQEWPVPGDARHQFSYTLPVLRLSVSPASGTGLGDFTLNWRYQLVGSGDSRLAIAPRLSLLLPTGDSRLGRGLGGAAVQANLPASVALAPRWVMHLNAGGTIAPRAQNEFGDRASISGFNLGQSFLWLAHSRFNVLLETVWSGQGSVAGPDQTEFSHALFLSPGIRWAHDFRNGLQIVPGLGFAVGLGPSAGEKAIVLYLSFEHPFGRSR